MYTEITVDACTTTIDSLPELCVDQDYRDDCWCCPEYKYYSENN